LAVEDLASAEFIYRRALEKRVGTTVTIGETRHE
jgi:ornithine cyclodeaminase/alanine dehydrogenase-like protein (mu-crystallin family)